MRRPLRSPRGWPPKPRQRTKTSRPKPTGWLKWAFKAPNYLYRAHLGFLLGKRFLMVEHRGRKSGQRFRTVIEVAGRNPESNEWIVCAGWGPKSDWYLNLRAGNLGAVWLGSHRYRDATARFLDNKEAGQVIARYEEAHPKAAKVLFRGMGVSHDGSYEGRAEMMKSLPMVAFRV